MKLQIDTISFKTKEAAKNDFGKIKNVSSFHPLVRYL